MRAQSQLKGQSPSAASALVAAQSQVLLKILVRHFCLKQLDPSISPTSDTPCVDLVCVQTLRVSCAPVDSLRMNPVTFTYRLINASVGLGLLVQMVQR
ncbi:hypothetical protein PMIT1313_00434 [Prochlorococcus marinus str. MIT 1313]|nr:hypothetical protein PMIT1313_00434 [Prochlorococcus marinus str. MIT 1313]KZR72990.1 hypothetical protein PMIT1318_00576 [Prochlorococcus marinus str. MIT 1318]